MILSISSPQGSEIYAEQEAERLYDPEVMNDCKEITFSRQNQADARMNSQRLGLHAQDPLKVKSGISMINVAESKRTLDAI